MSLRDACGQACPTGTIVATLNSRDLSLLPALPCPVTPPRSRWAKSQLPLGREAFPKSPLHPSTSMLGNLCIHPGLHKQPVVQPRCHTLQHKEVTARVSEKCEHLPPRVPSTAFLSAYVKKSAVGHCWDREDTFETPMASPATAQVSLWLPLCR